MDTNEMDRIASNAAINKMHAVNLAIVFGMGLSPNSPNMPLGVSADLGLFQTMVKVWITHAEVVFPEIEDEEDQESGSVNQAESVEMQSSEPSSPALENIPAPPRASLDDGQLCINSGPERGST
jgi:hypothetical protein